MEGVDSSLDNRRIIRDHEARLAESANIVFSAVRPFIQFQTAMLRLWSDYCELTARGVETSFETVLRTSRD